MTKDIDVLGVAQDDSPSSMHALALVPNTRSIFLILYINKHPMFLVSANQFCFVGGIEYKSICARFCSISCHCA